jgi:hypothetical protein
MLASLPIIARSIGDFQVCPEKALGLWQAQTIFPALGHTSLGRFRAAQGQVDRDCYRRVNFEPSAAIGDP